MKPRCQKLMRSRPQIPLQIGGGGVGGGASLGIWFNDQCRLKRKRQDEGVDECHCLSAASQSNGAPWADFNDPWRKYSASGCVRVHFAGETCTTCMQSLNTRCKGVEFGPLVIHKCVLCITWCFSLPAKWEEMISWHLDYWAVLTGTLSKPVAAAPRCCHLFISLFILLLLL